MESSFVSVSLSRSVCANKDVKTSSLDDRLLSAVVFYEWRGSKAFRSLEGSAGRFLSLSPIKFYTLKPSLTP